jgi:hypothetical protein
VKIKATCRRCGRDVFAEQIVATGGRCPWDGGPFSADYAIVLIEALAAAEESGTRLESALEQVAALRPTLTIDKESVTGGISASIAAVAKNMVTQG